MINLLTNQPFFKDKTIDSCELLEKQGYCNENYLVVVDGIKYIVRKFLRDDIDRNFEWKVHNLAYAQGITSEPLVFDKEQGFMVFEFLEGVHKEKLDAYDLKNLAITLQKLHTIKIDAEPIEINILTKTNEVQKAFKTIAKYEKEYVLCHNDLNPQNLLWAEDVKFIDWEYAGINDRYFDLACICVEFGLDVEMQKIFLENYDSDTLNFLDKLEAYKYTYIIVCEQWFDKNKLNQK